ncbi:hypothetical protein GH733_015073 [Mirounga leonina]|nr:hypothetical protein GH733_015073 [Mirounga leonina]
MASSESALEVGGRMCLKITIPSVFVGLDGVDLLYHNVEGFTAWQEASKYASSLLEAASSTIKKITFSEQCFYIFRALCGTMANDTLAPLPHPGATPWSKAFPYQYLLPPRPYNQCLGFPELGYSYGGGSACPQYSEGGWSGGSNCSDSDRQKGKDPKARDLKLSGNGNEWDHTTHSSLGAMGA